MPTVVRYTKPPNPFGCRWCGEDQASHGSRWVPSRGMHKWQQPTTAQTKARMRARRNARQS